ncbi:MAG: Phosphoglucomutase/phosphomannomutase [ANME-2 cluster archaeon]|nr:Phosphoglucomutase/phosphomannomutase [ANME-2 cluster archaeon]
MTLFGTNGVRGIANSEMTADMALNLGKSLGTYMHRHSLGTKVAVGRDTRVSGDMLKSAAIAGLLSTGMEVVDVYVLPTPALQYYVRDNANAGVMITASHNPREYNGLKIVAGDGTEFSRKGEAEVEQIYYAGEFHAAQWNETGNFSSDRTIPRTYMDGIISNVDADAIRTAGLTVVVDPGCGAGCGVTPILLRELGCRVISLNAQPDGTFPGRAPEPTREELGNLMNTVKAAGADLGVAHDGDADRVAFVDEKGEFLDEEDLLAIMAGHVLEGKKGRVVTPVSSSLKVLDVTESMGCELLWTAVGSIDVARKMIEAGAVFGGEGNGGLIFPEFQYCRDGAMTAAKMLEILASGRKLSELKQGIPEYYNTKKKIHVKDPKQVVEMLLTQDLPGDVGGVGDAGSVEDVKVDRTDGIKLWYPDGWILIRASGTEPLVRVYAESSTAGRTAELVGYGTDLVERTARKVR